MLATGVDKPCSGELAIDTILIATPGSRRAMAAIAAASASLRTRLSISMSTSRSWPISPDCCVSSAAVVKDPMQ